MTRATRDTRSIGAFEFECGESISELELAYETYGEFTGDNAVLVCHALTGSAHVASGPRGSESSPRSGDGGQHGDAAGQARAWWDAIVGPGKAIDTTEYFVVCVNVPGSCYGSTGPASIDPATDEPYGADFPPVTVTDWTRAQRRLLDDLGVSSLHAVVGGSVGGMNVLEWVKRYPDRVERAIPVATAARLDSQCVAIDGIARRAITTDPDWNGGDYYGGPNPDDGLALARQLGHVMYLSKESMANKFGRRAAGRDAVRDTFPADPAAGFFPYRDVESYLDYNADAFVDRFDANSYLYLTRAMDDYDLAAGHGSDADALAGFDGEVLCLSFTGDWHFTTDQAAALADAFRTAGVETAHHVIDSDHGHDAFLVEPENVGPPIADFLADGVAGRAVTDARTGTDRETAFAPVHASLFGD
ncbi:homoserine O-acetyltransferase MetX [Halococcus saccharolyticus]|uniref:Homoserine O-acetyltransferase n=1 Tax=Halococcus saccharolyticus DSM 5350 TaxID=1227455 RepID=M0MA88_9EURY|nr:homoserine O-acetyltransferase [Halococcus saccharolyticus]EMA42707.1 homoserine O-acetyltransferase [Halococcus saccharolyticus DSM 5350]